ncbi:hypothetical protein [Mesorhizobium sp. B2-6-5]|uniref:hypothetical protein n=1 Tax=Mesorhizobium sp. B2-6-5 TaxID=2589912 RepID=UPI00112B2F80|nr:hypothetical protein [Mesorhizobium sp. B2-6-5]TPJ32734.1 hypothetical protein FJ432_32035 [Mesorhizobium sp. B2-6-5]
MLYLDESQRADLNANIIRERPEIEKTVSCVCKLLNKLSPFPGAAGTRSQRGLRQVLLRLTELLKDCCLPRRERK